MPVLEGILSPRELGVISLRFGLTDGQPRTLDELGRTYGVTQFRILQILDRAMQRLRDHYDTDERLSKLVVTDDQGLIVDFIDVRPAYRAADAEADAAALQRANIIWCHHCRKHRFASNSLTSAGGRPRKYCSNKCRQAAYRARRSLGGSPSQASA